MTMAWAKVAAGTVHLHTLYGGSTTGGTATLAARQRPSLRASLLPLTRALLLQWPTPAAVWDLAAAAACCGWSPDGGSDGSDDHRADGGGSDGAAAVVPRRRVTAEQLVRGAKAVRLPEGDEPVVSQTNGSRGSDGDDGLYLMALMAG